MTDEIGWLEMDPTRYTAIKLGLLDEFLTRYGPECKLEV